MEQNLSRSPRYLMNEMKKKYDERVFIEHTFYVHIDFNVMPSKRPKFEG